MITKSLPRLILERSKGKYYCAESVEEDGPPFRTKIMLKDRDYGSWWKNLLFKADSEEGYLINDEAFTQNKELVTLLDEIGINTIYD